MGRGRGGGYQYGTYGAGRGGHHAHRSWTNPGYVDSSVPTPSTSSGSAAPANGAPDGSLYTTRPSRSTTVAIPRHYPTVSKHRSLVILQPPSSAANRDLAAPSSADPTTNSSSTTHNNSSSSSGSSHADPPSIGKPHSQPQQNGYIKQGMSLVRLDEHGKRASTLNSTTLTSTASNGIRRARPRGVKRGLRLRVPAAAAMLSRASADGLPLVADTHRWITKSTHSRQLISKQAIEKGLYVQQAEAMVSKAPSAPKHKLLTVNGVVFVMDRHGKKLVRQDVAIARTAPSTVSQSGLAGASRHKGIPPQHTPRRVMIGDEAYVRTKRGNLVRAAALTKRKNARRTTKPKRPCPTYLRTGTCPRAKPPSEPIPADFRLCTLNHQPALQQIPLCRHFELGRCVSDACKYLHIKMSAHAKVCVAFARHGWCDRADHCDERHVWECPGWLNHGVCDVEGEQVTIDVPGAAPTTSTLLDEGSTDALKKEAEPSLQTRGTKRGFSHRDSGPRCGYKHYLWRKGFATRTPEEERRRRREAHDAVLAETSRKRLEQLLPDFDQIEQMLLHDDEHDATLHATSTEDQHLDSDDDHDNSDDDEDEDDDDEDDDSVSEAEEGEGHERSGKRAREETEHNVLFVRDLEDDEVLDDTSPTDDQPPPHSASDIHHFTDETKTEQPQWDFEGDYLHF